MTVSVPMLEVTFRKGRPLAAYLRVAHGTGKVANTRELAPNLVGDFGDAGELRGLEILAFDAPTLSRINEVLGSHGVPALPDRELAPLTAA